MPKTVTLRLADSVYDAFRRAATSEHRSLANLIETAALRHLEEAMLVDEAEMDALLADEALCRHLRNGSRAAKTRQGRLIG